MKMKTEKFVHACPVQIMVWNKLREDWEPCEADVTLHYDVGRSPEDFYLQDEAVFCTRFHRIDSEVVGKWWKEDWREMAEREQERAEAAYQCHVDAQIERARLKED